VPEPIVLMVERYEPGKAREAEPVVVTVGAYSTLVELDDGTLLIFDARELQQAIEGPGAVVGARAGTHDQNHDPKGPRIA
jgi:hypothetical protein